MVEAGKQFEDPNSFARSIDYIMPLLVCNNTGQPGMYY